MNFSVWFKSSDWTQAEFARAIGTPRQTVQSWLSGRTTPTLFYALAIEALSGGKVLVTSWLTDRQKVMLRGMLK